MENNNMNNINTTEINTTEKNEKVEKNNKTRKIATRLTISIITLIATALCLTLTTFAVVYSMISVEDNFFATGIVEVNLNDGKPVISQGEYLLEPGATVKKDFFIENLSTCEVYYRLYFSNVGGGLADVLEVEIRDGDTVLAKGTPTELNRENVPAFEGSLEVEQTKTLQIYFHFPENAGNSAQNESLSFDLNAEAVQTKNNPDKSFD